MSIYVDWGSSLSGVEAPRAHLFALLTATMPNVTMDFEQELVDFNGQSFPFEMLGLGAGNETGWNMTYTVKGTYEDSSGKFSQVFGNVVLIDCDYIVEQIIDEMFRELDAAASTITWQVYYEIYALLNYINAEVKQN